MSGANGGMGERRTLLLALAVDNVGSGLFMPLNVIFLTRAAGLSLPAAGWTLTAGTAVGLVVPYLAARHVDHRGPGPVLVVALLCQGVAMLGYLLASGVHPTLVAAVAAALNGAGIQLFYSALGVMTVRVAAGGDTDRSFAGVAMVRTAAFGVGGLVGGSLIAAGPMLLRVAVALNAITFVAAAVLVSRVRASPPTRVPESTSAATHLRWRDLLRDRALLLLLPVVTALGLSVDLFLVVMPPWAHQIGVPGWAVGLCIAVNTALGATLAHWTIDRTSGLRRTTSLALALVLLVLWSMALATLSLLTAPAAAVALIGLTVLLAAAGLLANPRLAAIVSALAPAEGSGRHFAALQYAFTAAQLLAPLTVPLLALGTSWPWLAYVAILVLCAIPLALLRRALPPATDRPTPIQNGAIQNGAG